MADLMVGRDLVLPPLDAVQTTALAQALGPHVALANPLDYHTYIWADEQVMGATYSAMMQGNLALGIVVSDFPRSDRCTAMDWEPVINATHHASSQSGKPMAILASLPENISEATADRLVGLGIAPLCGMDDGIAAIEAAAWLGQQKPGCAPLLLPKDPGHTETLSEDQAKAALAQFGVERPKSKQGTSKDIASLAQDVGFPCVLKGEGIAHKTEAGAVALNLMSSEAVATAAQNMPTHRFLLEEMITDSIAELLIGVVRDPAHGFVLTIAAGGILTEVLQDRVSLLLPVTKGDVAKALEQLKLYPVLVGFRGRPPVNMAALIDAIISVQDFFVAHQGQLEEVEINPLLLTQTRAVMADALIRCHTPLN